MPTVPEDAKFDLHLGGQVSGLTPAALYAITSQTTALVSRMGELALPDSQVIVRVTEVRRGSLVVGFVLEALDDLARLSPTAHVAMLGVIGLALRQYFKFVVEEMKHGLDISSEGNEIHPVTPEDLARRAATDDVFKSRVSDLIDTVRSLPDVESLGIGASKETPEDVIPAGYFLDVQRKLLVPTDLSTRTVKLPDHRVFLDRPVGDPAGKWRVMWWEGEDRVEVVADIAASRLKAFLAERYDPNFRQMVVDVEFTEIVNRRTKDRVVSNARITRVRHLPHRVPAEPAQWLRSTSVLQNFRALLPGLLRAPKRDDENGDR